jgi:Mrp family chromosome partitioning ATPase
MTGSTGGRAAWLRRRAANVRRRPNLVGGIACASFAVLLVVLIASSPGAWRASSALSMPSTPRPDTLALLRDVARAAARLDSANAALADAYAAARRARRRVPVDTFPPSVRARRDSLSAELTELGTLLKRAESAPLPASYRALGAAPRMRNQPLVTALLDSLAIIEQTRSAFDAERGVDPVFVALTARAADIGQEIRELALHAYSGLRLELAAITPVAPRTTPVVVPDTVPLVAARDSATVAQTAAAARLARARVVSVELDAEAASARARVAMGAPPLALLAAAAVLALVAGFGAALVLELREPFVADAAEAEAAGLAPVLAVVRPQPVIPERARRQADRDLPPLIHPLSDTYQRLYIELADHAFDLSAVTIVGDHPMVTAVVAANLAAVAARQPRATLLVDTDAETHAVAAVTRVRHTPGLTDVLELRLDWSEAITAMVVGRDRTMDVLPSGVAASAPGGVDDGAPEMFRVAMAHLERRYDTVVVSAPASSTTTPATVGPVILCARVGRTSIAALTALATGVTARGASVQGLVLWDMSDPPAPAPREHRGPGAAGSADGDALLFDGAAGRER